MNSTEQKHHRTVTQNLDKRLTDVEEIAGELGARQQDMLAALKHDLATVTDATNRSFEQERKLTDMEVAKLRNEIRQLRAWQISTWSYRFWMWWTKFQLRIRSRFTSAVQP